MAPKPIRRRVPRSLAVRMSEPDDSRRSSLGARDRPPARLVSMIGIRGSRDDASGVGIGGVVRLKAGSSKCTGSPGRMHAYPC